MAEHMMPDTGQMRLTALYYLHRFTARGGGHRATQATWGLHLGKQSGQPRAMDDKLYGFKIVGCSLVPVGRCDWII